VLSKKIKAWARLGKIAAALTILLVLFVNVAAAESDPGNANEPLASTKNDTPLHFAPDRELKFRESDGVGFSLFFNIMLILAFITLLLYIVLYLVKKQGLMGLPKDEDNKKIKTLGIKRLGGKTVLYHLEIDGKQFVICHNDNSINVQKIEPIKQNENL